MAAIPLPKYVQIEPVGQCNLRCQMCPIQFREDGPPYGPPAFMQFDLFERIIDEFEDLETLHLQGLGEPMMHPRFFDMVAHAKAKGIQVTTNSNMTLLNAKRAALCVDCGLDELHVSIDGARPETYERIRVRGHYDKVMRNLRLLQEAQQKAGRENPKLKLVMVVMRQNLEELPELVRQAHRWGMEEVFVQHLAHAFTESSLPEQYRPMREFVENETLLNEDLERVERYFGEAREAAQSLGVKLRLPSTRMRIHPPGTPGRERCDWPWTGAYISYEGYAMPCCMVATPDRINFGSIAGRPVKALWNGKPYQEFREQLSSDTPPEICSACSIYSGTF